MKKFFHFLIALLLLISSISTSISFASPTDSNVERGVQNVFPLKDDLTIQGVAGANDFFFNKNDYWNLNSDPYIDLKLKITPLKARNDSTLTISLNSTPIDTILLDDKAGEFSWKVTLPKSLLKNGSNNINFKLFHTISPEICTDDLNPGNWISIKKESYIHMEYSYIESDLKISNFPYPYILSEDPTPENAVIVLSNNPSKKEMIEALRLNHLLSSFSTTKVSNLKIINYDMYLQNFADKYHAIFIAEKKNTLPVFSSFQAEINSDYGYIRQLQTPSSFKNLLISGDISAAVSGLENKVAKNQMNDSLQFVDLKRDYTKSRSLSDTLKFKDFGFSDSTVEGIFYKNIPYFIQLPGSKRIGKDSSLKLNLRYSQFTDFENSNMTLYIENKPVYSYKLKSYEGGKSDFKTYTFSIPDEFANRRSLNLELRFYLSAENLRCNLNKPSSSNLWVSVLDSSSISVGNLNTSSPIFDDFPDNLVNMSQNKGLHLLLESNSDFEKLNLYSNVLNNTFKLKSLPEKIEISSSTPTDFLGSLIAIGSPDKNEFTKELNSVSLLPFDETYKNFKSTSGVPVMKNPFNNLVSFQMINGPAQDESMIFYISAEKSENLDFLPSFLEKESLSFLNGNLVLINQEKPISYFYIGQVKSEIDKINSQAAKSAKNSKPLTNSQLQIIIITSIFVLTFLSIFIYILKKEQKNKK